MRRPRSTLLVAAVAVLTFGVVSAPGASANQGGGGHIKRVRALDDCDPATFNVAFPGMSDLCTGDGETTFADFVSEVMATGQAEDWKFKPDDLELESGDQIKVQNRGGEFHTFTKVARFGGGCVPELNTEFSGPVVDECLGSEEEVGALFGQTGVAPGDTRLMTQQLTLGTNFFQCLIHPWMRTTVEVESDHHH